jgi:hypothetical protein
VEILGSALYQVLLQSAVVLVLLMHMDQLRQILRAVAVAAVVVQPRTQVQIMVEHQHKLCPLALRLNMETLEVQLQMLHTNLVVEEVALVRLVVR